jgi:hypothetical protein
MYICVCLYKHTSTYFCFHKSIHIYICAHIHIYRYVNICTLKIYSDLDIGNNSTFMSSIILIYCCIVIYITLRKCFNFYSNIEIITRS